MFNQKNIQLRINKAISLATTYLEQQAMRSSDDYVLALSSYALTLAHSSQADAVYQRLNNDAIIAGKPDTCATL